MRAIEIGPPGGPESARIVSRERPRPGPGQVLVRVLTVSLNYRDLRLLAAPESSFIPACECAGEVVEIGSAGPWHAGDLVVNSFYPTWLDGRFDSSYLATVRGAGIDGVLTEFVVFDGASLVHIPEHLSPREAATIPCAGVTAFNALCGGRGISAGDTVLVLGTGGVSLYALQLAAAAGATVIVTSSSDERLARAEALGARHLVNYRRTPDWAAEVLALTGGRGTEFVVDVVGDIERSARVLADNGELSLIGTSLGGERTQTGIRAADLSVGFTTVRRFIVGPHRMLVDTVQRLRDTGIVPVVGAEFAFGEAATAFGQLSRGGVFGKIVVHVADQ
jgi:NADPH:quinone reductase-like Zn-dependent oxidoreductase